MNCIYLNYGMKKYHPYRKDMARFEFRLSLKIFGLTFLSDISCVFNCADHLLYVYVIVLFFVLLFFYFMLKSWLCYYLFFRQETERSQTSIHGAV